MGDCNAPSTFQWLMTVTFQDFIRKFVHVYLDDIFIYSNSLEIEAADPELAEPNRSRYGHTYAFGHERHLI